MSILNNCLVSDACQLLKKKESYIPFSLGPASLYPIFFLFENEILVFAWLSVQNSLPQTETANLQQALCYNVYLGFVFAHESLVASQVRLPSLLCILI